jgi:hypothetical protein
MLSVGTGLKLKTSERGCARPSTGDEVFTLLARIAVIRPENVKPADGDARQMVERVRREPETRRLVALVAEQRRGQRRDPILYVPAPFMGAERPREHRSRSRTRQASRDGPDGDDPAPGRAGLPTLRVIPPAVCRRQVDSALGGRR